MIIRFTYYSIIQFFIVNNNVHLVFFRINCKNKKNINGTPFLKKKYDSYFHLGNRIYSRYLTVSELHSHALLYSSDQPRKHGAGTAFHEIGHAV